MSFDVNVLSAKPVIKPAASMQNDGGGGNLGYMSQGRRQQKDESKNIFAMDNVVDTFGAAPKYEVEDFKFSFVDFVLEVWDAVKSFFTRK